MSPDEFDEFYAGSVHRLVGQLYAMTGNFTEAQDVVQDAFVRAWDKQGQLDPTLSPEAWVRTVAWRLAVSRYRRGRGLAATWLRHQRVATAAEPDVVDPELLAALRTLPEAQRRAVVLHYLVDLPVSEVARETGVPVETVKARLSRGRGALAQILSQPDDAEARHA